MSLSKLSDFDLQIKDFIDEKNECLLCERVFNPKFYANKNHILKFHTKEIFKNVCNYCLTIFKITKGGHLKEAHQCNNKLKKSLKDLIKYFDNVPLKNVKTKIQDNKIKIEDDKTKVQDNQLSKFLTNDTQTIYCNSDFFITNHCLLCKFETKAKNSSHAKHAHVSTNHIKERYLSKVCNYCFRFWLSSCSKKSHLRDHINTRSFDYINDLVNYFSNKDTKKALTLDKKSDEEKTHLIECDLNPLKSKIDDSKNNKSKKREHKRIKTAFYDSESEEKENSDKGQ